MGKITFQDKKTLNDLNNIQEDRKWTSNNANEVKNVVNGIDDNLTNLSNKVDTMEQIQISHTNNLTQHTNEISSLQQVDQHHNAEIGRVEGITTAINTRLNTNIDPRLTAAEGSITHNANVNNNQEARITALEQRPQNQIVTAHFHTYNIQNDLGYTWVNTSGDGNNRGYTWQTRITLKPLPNGIQPTHNNVISLLFSGVPDVVRCYYWETATTIMMTMRKNTRQTDDYRKIMSVMNIQITVLSGGHFRSVESGIPLKNKE